MMPEPLWQMHRSLQVAHTIWTFDIRSYANGFNAILLSSNGLIPPSMKQITSQNSSLGSSSIGTLTTSWVTCHQNTLRHTNDPRANSTSPLLISLPSCTRQKKPCRLSSNWSRMIYIYQLLQEQHVYIPQTTEHLPTHSGQRLLLVLVFLQSNLASCNIELWGGVSVHSFNVVTSFIPMPL